MQPLMPNHGNINAVAQGSGINAFSKGQHLIKEVGEHQAKKARMQAASRNKARRDWAAGVNQAVNQSQAQKKTQQQQAAAQAKQATQAQKTQAANVKAGRAAPAPGAAPRVFAMPAGPAGQAAAAHAKVRQQQINYAHGQAIQMQNAMNKQAAQAQANHAKVLKQQVNYAHGQAISMQNQMNRAAAKAKPATPAAKAPTMPTFSHAQNTQAATPATGPKPSTNPFKVNTIQTPSPAKKAAPVSKGPVKFSNVSPQSNAPYPTHVHPAGSSSAILPHLSATETGKTGRPNEFTVGSRNIKGSGIAAMGSKLEEGLRTKPFPVPEPKRRV